MTGRTGQVNVFAQKGREQNIPSGPARYAEGDHTNELPEEIHRIIEPGKHEIKVKDDTGSPRVPIQAKSRAVFDYLSY